MYPNWYNNPATQKLQKGDDTERSGWVRAARRGLRCEMTLMPVMWRPDIKVRLPNKQMELWGWHLAPEWGGSAWRQGQQWN